MIAREWREDGNERDSERSKRGGRVKVSLLQCSGASLSLGLLELLNLVGLPPPHPGFTQGSVGAEFPSDETSFNLRNIKELLRP